MYKDTKGQWRTRSLFKETIDPTSIASGWTPEFTLKEQDDDGLPSMRRLYMDIGDPTEYQFAMDVLGSWEHWCKMCESKWFSEHVEKWRAELETKLRSDAVMDLVEIAKAGTGQSTQAAKWLAEGRWKEASERKATKRGRPSKAEVRGALREEVEARTEEDEEAARVFSVVKGGKGA